MIYLFLKRLYPKYIQPIMKDKPPNGVINAIDFALKGRILFNESK